MSYMAYLVPGIMYADNVSLLEDMYPTPAIGQLNSDLHQHQEEQEYHPYPLDQQVFHTISLDHEAGDTQCKTLAKFVINSVVAGKKTNALFDIFFSFFLLNSSTLSTL